MSWTSRCARLLVLAALLVGAVAAAAEEGTIEAGRSTYRARPEKYWKGRGRLVGIAKKAPVFEVTVLREGKEIASQKAEEGKDGTRAYEIWLEPGTYDLRVEAQGYRTLELKGLVVKANHDLRTDLEFTPPPDGD